ncbi:MAG: SIR2 family protein [Verrucomicrobiales bacterium]|nr:SIR2 family protein [Verrucomicrobiales bacterium]
MSTDDPPAPSGEPPAPPVVPLDPPEESSDPGVVPLDPSEDSKSSPPDPPKPELLKTRDDRMPVPFDRTANDFQVRGDDYPAWAPEGKFEISDLRQRIEPWLTALFQSEHLSLLVGSGLTHAMHWMAADGPAAGMDTAKFEEYDKEIRDAANSSAKEAKRSGANLEDDLRVANELIRGLEIQGDEKAEKLRTQVAAILEDFAESILKSETGIVEGPSEKREQAWNTLVNFLMSFASRSGTRERLNIFTTNYDRILEAGAELAGVHLLDRFVGTLTPIFRSSRLDVDMHYNPPGIRGEPRYLEGVVRYAKLHGSIDWVNSGHEIRRMGVPLGAEKIAPFLKAPGLMGATPNQLMIFPNSAKDRETAHFPYVDLFRDFASAVCRPNSTLVTYGFSFGDEHINRIIEDMLTIPSTHLVVIARSDSMGRISEMYDRLGRRSQITLLVGETLGDLATLTENFLPKSAIDRATSRMSELLKMRYPTEAGKKKETEDDQDSVSDLF